jgi:mannosyltransferase
MARPAWSDRTVALLVTGEVLLSLVLGFHALGRKSLWNDEGLSAMVSSSRWSDILSRGNPADANARTPAMVGYHAVLKVWRVLGSSETVLRSLSVIAVAATVIAVFAVTARLCDRATGVLAGFLAAVAPFAVRYAQEARGYALMMLLVTVSMWCFVVAVETGRDRWWVLYVLVAAAACYAHAYGGFVIVAQGLSLVLLGRDRVPVRKVVVAAGVLVVLVLPLLLLLTSGSQSGSGSKPTVSSSLSVISNMAGGKLLLVVLAGLAVVPVVELARRWRASGPSLATWRVGLVVVWIVVPVAAAFVFAFITKSWQPRYVIAVLPALCIAAAMGLRRLGDRRIVVAALVGIAVLAGFKMRNWYDAPAHEDWRAVTAYVVRSSHPSDGVVFCIPSVRPTFEYYVDRADRRRRPTPLSPAQPWGAGFHAIGAGTRAVQSWSQAPERIWVVSRYAGANDPGACDLAESMRGRTRTTSREIGNVQVERWDLD